MCISPLFDEVMKRETIEREGMKERNLCVHRGMEEIERERESQIQVYIERAGGNR